MDKDQPLVVVIGGNEMPSRYVMELLEGNAKNGHFASKRIYGNYRKQSLNKLRKPANSNLYHKDL